MFRRFFIWRAHRQLARTRYRLDRRHYPGQFQAGFMSHLHHARFWETNKDPGTVRRRWRKRVFWMVAIMGSIFFFWVVYESAHALMLLRS